MPDRDQSVTVVIPARFGSSRFPGKPLTLLAGKPLIRQVYEHAEASLGVDQVLVVTDDTRICEAVEAFGGTAMMIDQPFRSGTDRVAAVARQVSGRFFINLQGDEVVLHPRLLTDLIGPFLQSGAELGTLRRRLASQADFLNPAVVKVVTDDVGRALYFSRAPIPHSREEGPSAMAADLSYIHLGIYMYTRHTLLRFSELPTGKLEETEQLEQLRALEYGIPIRVWDTSYASLRIDTPEDVKEAAAVLKQVEAQ
jgi:3-deoxy-manno-octulosonate cytidylyltransferase (CMP-KDO synthetase)